MLVVDDALSTVAINTHGNWEVHDDSVPRLTIATPPGRDDAPGSHPVLAGLFTSQDLWLVDRTTSPSRYRLFAIERLGWRIRTEVEVVSDHPSGFALHPHPAGQGVVLESGRGQHGCDLWSVDPTSTGVEVRKVPGDGRGFAGFVDDDRLLLVPPTTTSLVVAAWPTGTIRQVLAPRDVLLPRADGSVDDFLSSGFAADPGHVVTDTRGGRLVVITLDTGDAVAELRVPGIGWRHDPDPTRPARSDLEGVQHLGGSRFVVGNRSPGSTIWAVPLPRQGPTGGSP